MADGNLGKLIVEITTDATELGKGLAAASKQISSAAKGMTLAIAGITAAFAAGIKSSVDYGSEIYRLSKVTGLGAEALTELKYAAEQSAVPMELLTTGFRFLSRNVSDAIQGNMKLRIAFQELGVSLDDLKNKNMTQLFEQVSAAIKNVPNDMEKTALAMDIFGRSGANLLPFLTTSADEIERLRREAHELGVVLTDQSAKDLDTFNNSLKSLQASIRGVWLDITIDLLPALNNFVKAIKESGIIKDISEGIQDTLEALMELPGWIKLSAVAMVLLGTAVGRTIGILLLGPDILQGWTLLFAEIERLALGAAKAFSYLQPAFAGDIIRSWIDAEIARIDAAEVVIVNRKTMLEKLMEDINKLKAEIDAFSAEGPPSFDIPDIVIKVDFAETMNAETQKARASLITMIEGMKASWASFYDFLNMGIQTFSKSFSGALSSIILGTKDAGQAFKDFGIEMITAIVNFVVEWAVQAIIAMTIGAALNAAISAQAGALAASWAPAAFLASVATLGGAVAAGSAALGAGLALNTCLVAGISAAAGAVKPMATGGEGIVTRPTLFMAGEAGPERYSFEPLSGGALAGAGGISITIENANMTSIDNVRQLAEEIDYIYRKDLER